MASSLPLQADKGESAAMAQAFATVNQPLAASSASQRDAIPMLPHVANGQSMAMAESFAHINQPLKRTAYSTDEQTHAGHSATAFMSYNGQSVAVARTFANIEQPLKMDATNAGSHQVVMNERL